MKATAPPILSGVWGLPGVIQGLGVALEARHDGAGVVADHV